MAVLFFWTIALCPGVLIARMVLAPAFRAAKHHRRPAQFSLLELAALVVYQSAALALGYVPLTREFRLLPSAHYLFVGFACLCAVSLWWIAVSTLSRAGVTALRKRLLFLMTVPLVYVAAVVALPSALIVLSGMSPRLLARFLSNDLAAAAILALVIGRLITKYSFGGLQPNGANELVD